MSSHTDLEVRVPGSIKEKIRYISKVEGKSITALVQESLRSGNEEFLPVRCLGDTDNDGRKLVKDARLYLTLDRTLYGSLQQLPTHTKKISAHCRDIALGGSHWFYED
jgi:hypothetical protein